MSKDYPNKRDCEHGSLRGSCVYCELEEAYAELEQCKKNNFISQLIGERNSLRRISHMQLADGWLRHKCEMEIKRITNRIEELSE